MSKSSKKATPYCGMGKIPSGRKRGTAEECLQCKQVRYYGVEAIDKEAVTKKKKPSPTKKVKEQLKLKKLQDRAKILVKEVKNLKVIIEDPEVKPSQLKAANKKMDTLLMKRDKLKEQLIAQKKVVDAIED